MKMSIVTQHWRSCERLLIARVKMHVWGQTTTVAGLFLWYHKQNVGTWVPDQFPCFIFICTCFFLSSSSLFYLSLSSCGPPNFLLLQHIQRSVTVIQLFQVFRVSKSRCRWGASEQESEPMHIDSRAAPERLHPNSTGGEGRKGKRERKRKRDRGGGGLSNTHHT